MDQVHALQEWCCLQVGTVRDLPQQSREHRDDGGGENVAGEKMMGLSLDLLTTRCRGHIQMGEGKQNWEKQGWKLGVGSDLELYL